MFEVDSVIIMVDKYLPKNIGKQLREIIVEYDLPKGAIEALDALLYEVYSETIKGVSAFLRQAGKEICRDRNEQDTNPIS
jgi:hypothetical protein